MLKRLIQNNEANVSIIFSGSILALLLVTGLSTDSLASYNVKRDLQAALDSAVLAAAINAEEMDYTRAGTQAFHDNLLNDRLNNISLNFTEDSDILNGTASANLPLFFGNILPREMVSIRVNSSANISVPEAFPCIIALNPNVQPGVLINGG